MIKFDHLAQLGKYVESDQFPDRSKTHDTNQSKKALRAAAGVGAVVLIATHLHDISKVGGDIGNTISSHESPAESSQHALRTMDGIKRGVIQISAGAQYRESPDIANGDNSTGDQGNGPKGIPKGQELMLNSPVVKINKTTGDTWVSAVIVTPTENGELPLQISKGDREAHSVWLDLTQLEKQGLATTLGIDGNEVIASTLTSNGSIVAKENDEPLPGVAFGYFDSASNGR